jgi:hypothetical protein
MFVKVFIVLIGVVIAILLLGWVGLKIKPSPFPALSQSSPQSDYVPLPAGLPAPVERFYRLTYGEKIPVIQTAVISGRGDMRFAGLPVPIRFRFTHEAGQTYRHEIELTFFGVTWMKGLDTFIDGHGWANTPGYSAGEGFDQGSNVSLWAEALNWFPALLVTDPRVQWKPVDSATALLDVPFGAAREMLIVRFDPDSGKVQYVEAMKFKAAIGKKVLWTNSVWFDEGTPWIHLNVEEAVYNVAVHDTIRAPRP